MTEEKKAQYLNQSSTLPHFLIEYNTLSQNYQHQLHKVIVISHAIFQYHHVLVDV